MDKKGKDIDLKDWQDIHPQDIPLQMNGSDCGVFMCKYADFISKNAPFTFDQENMPYFRKRMILDIISKSYSY